MTRKTLKRSKKRNNRKKIRRRKKTRNYRRINKSKKNMRGGSICRAGAWNYISDTKGKHVLHQAVPGSWMENTFHLQYELSDDWRPKFLEKFKKQIDTN